MLSWSLCALALAKEPLPAVVDELDRIEVTASVNDQFEVEALGDAGVGVIQHAPGDDGWSVRWYDRALHEQWSKPLEVAPRADLQDSYAGEDAVWLAFAEPGGGGLKLLRVDPETGPATVLTIPTSRTVRYLRDLVVVGREAWALGLEGAPVAAAGRRGAVLHIDLQRLAVTPVDLSEQLGGEKGTFQRLRAVGSDRVELGFSTTRKGVRTVHVADLQGDHVVAHASLNASAESHNLLNAQLTRLADGRQMVLGTYDDDRRGTMATGLYVALGSDGTMGRPVYHAFSSFTHFFDYLSEGQRKRITARSERAEEKGEDLDTSYFLDLHDAIERADDVLFAAEAFTPVYTAVTTTTTSVVNGQTVRTTTTRMVFIGWRYTHAMVASFGRDGSLRWDASLPFDADLTREIRERLVLRPTDAGVDLMWPLGRKVAVAHVVHDEVDAPQAPTGVLTTSEESETVRSARQTGAAAWFGDEFLLYGLEKIQGDGQRVVFALTRVRAKDG